MTEILELAKQAGFIKQDMSLAHEAIEKNVYLVPSDSHLREFASLLREKFIADLGDPAAYRATIPNKDGTYHWAFGEVKGSGLGVAWYTPLYALPKDKDELK